MTRVFVERRWDPPLTPADLDELSRQSADCLQLHRIAWHGSLMSTDGRYLLCQFNAPDLESVRNALRQVGSAAGRVWPGTVHEAPAPSTPGRPGASVLVSRQFDAPTRFETLQAMEERAAACLETHRVRFLRSFFATDRTRMICLYTAPDAESVRLAQRQAGMPVEGVLACREFLPERA